MNDRDALRYAARRAAFIRAVRDGDAVAAARTGARLRLFDAAIVPGELLRARDARRALGRAILSARRPPPAPAVERHESPITAPRGRGRRRALLALALLALMLIALIPLGAPQEGGGGSPQAAATEQQRSALLTVSRGRTVGAAADVVVLVETASPSPTPEPTEEPSPQPQSTSGAAASSAPGSAGATGSTGPGGSGGGGGGGDGGGQGAGNGRGNATPTRAPVVTLGPVPAGFARLIILVVDGQTRRPIPDACVVVGTASCLPGQPHTDANGRWTADVAASSSATYWDVSVIMPGYRTESRRLYLRAGSVPTTFAFTMRRTR